MSERPAFVGDHSAEAFVAVWEAREANAQEVRLLMAANRPVPGASRGRWYWTLDNLDAPWLSLKKGKK